METPETYTVEPGEAMLSYDAPVVAIREKMMALLAEMYEHQPGWLSAERNGNARAWQIGITEMQKVLAWWQMYCVDRLDHNPEDYV